MPQTRLERLSRNPELAKVRTLRSDLTDTTRGTLCSGQHRRGFGQEGTGRVPPLLDISLGSLSELSYLLQVSRELGYLNATEWAELDQLGNRARFLTWRLCQA